ncbi:uncharacterized protein LOC126401127 [Epinephelus moara]|uniref:uncharacterized protein LOC126401127 n=1 Tax=Epinephelus moara TaxID=300413 RepID=UPI00214DFCD0|nr:uncharacterized protein LOC126401127 [Epinephelus moara]
MRQLSHCIFEVDLGDAYCLTEMKRSKLAGKRRMVGLTEAKVIRRISKEEWRLHCRRRPCGTVESALLIQDLLNTFGKPAESMMEFPLLNALRIQDILTSSPAPPQPQPRPSSSSLRKRRTTALLGFYPVTSSSYDYEKVKDDGIQEEEGSCRAGAATGEQNSPGNVAVCLQEVWPAQKTRDQPHSAIWGDLLHVGRRKIRGGIEAGGSQPTSPTPYIIRVVVLPLTLLLASRGQQAGRQENIELDYRVPQK